MVALQILVLSAQVRILVPQRNSWPHSGPAVFVTNSHSPDFRDRRSWGAPKNLGPQQQVDRECIMEHRRRNIRSPAATVRALRGARP